MPSREEMGYTLGRVYKPNCLVTCSSIVTIVRMHRKMHAKAKLRAVAETPSRERSGLKLAERDLFSLAHASAFPLERLWSIRDAPLLSSLSPLAFSSFSPSENPRPRGKFVCRVLNFAKLKSTRKDCLPLGNRSYHWIAAFLSAWKRGSPQRVNEKMQMNEQLEMFKVQLLRRYYVRLKSLSALCGCSCRIFHVLFATPSTFPFKIVTGCMNLIA